VPGSQEFFNIAFFAVVLSTLVQGATIEPLSRRLRMNTSIPALPRPLGESGTVQAMGAEIMEYPVVRGDAVVGMHVRDLGLPRDALVNVIVRGGRAIPPRGSTRISAGDVLHVMVTQASAKDLYPLLERWRKGPMRTEPAREEEVWMTMPVTRARRHDDGEE
jgi:potassium/hydrogen antiporter